ncbi:MAG: UDP-N-acetylglucosamine pyrophosphorylase [Lachnospiraceae bacterium]|nr:UDP-N-acetylglucosamine pyrophosphorylase [Lachnospiraceae bacterium]
MYTNNELFDFTQTLAAPLFENTVYPWEILPQIKDFILKLVEMLPEDRYEKRAEGVWVAKTAKVAPTAYLGAPVIVGEYAEVRHCAFVRGSALIGEHATVGNSTELKNVILFAHVEVPHYNYVGDSILGYYAHMGAGSITSNVKADRGLVVVKDGEEHFETGLKKFGAILGDHVEVGCNSVLNPGTVVGKNSNIYPLSMVRGVVPENSIYKNRNDVVEKRQEGYIDRCKRDYDGR